MKTKVVIFLLCIGMLSMGMVFATPSPWAEDSVITLKYLDFIDGDLGDMSRMQEKITREEFAELAVKMYLKAKSIRLEHIEVGSRFIDTENIEPLNNLKNGAIAVSCGIECANDGS